MGQLWVVSFFPSQVTSTLPVWTTGNKLRLQAGRHQSKGQARVALASLLAEQQAPCFALGLSAGRVNNPRSLSCISHDLGGSSAPLCHPSRRHSAARGTCTDSWQICTASWLLSSSPSCRQSPAALPRGSRSGPAAPHGPCCELSLQSGHVPAQLALIPGWALGEHPKEISTELASWGARGSLGECSRCPPGRQCCFIRQSLPPLTPRSLQRGDAPAHYCKRNFHLPHKLHDCWSLPVSFTHWYNKSLLLPPENGANLPPLLPKHQEPLLPFGDVLQYHFVSLEAGYSFVMLLLFNLFLGIPFSP